MTDEEALLLLKEKISLVEKTKTVITKQETDLLWEDTWEPSEQDLADMYQDAKQERETEEDGTLLYNTITKQNQNYKSFKKQYGKKWADIYLKAKKANQRVPEELSREFWKEFGKPTTQTISTIVEKEIAPVNDKIFDEPIEDNDKSFIQLFKSMTGDDELLRIMRNCMTLYLYLAGNIQRKPRENDSFNIYENYYKKDILAFAETETVISRRTGISRRCIIRYVKHMKDNGIIEIDKKIRTTQEGTKEHNIYILGTVNGKGNYNLFINKKCWKTPHNVLDRK